MKVLIVSALGLGNRYIDDLVTHLNHYSCEIITNIDLFWAKDQYFDIVHIQWIEALFNWDLNNITPAKVASLEERLKEISKSGKIIVTRHNKIPHREYKYSKLIKTLYSTVYKHCHAIIHLGKFSITDFISEEPEIAGCILHKVIRHGNYLSLPNNTSKEMARKFLKLESNRIVILVFGSIRTPIEQDFTLKVFKRISSNKKILLANRWTEDIIGHNNTFVKNWHYLLSKFLYNLRSEYKLRNEFTREDDIQYYLNAADIVFIPREKGLNSGIIYLGLSFGKIVVAPSLGNNTEILEETGNPSFAPGNEDRAINALNKAVELLDTDLPAKNMHYAREVCSWDKIATEHYQLYSELLSIKY